MSKFKDNVPGFPGYPVTKDGEVYSMKCRSGKRPKAFKLKPRLSGNGYYRIGLYKDGIKYERRLNRLVAMIYIPNPDNLPLVCHRDNNPLNNKVENLYWGSIEDNIKDREDRYEMRDIIISIVREPIVESVVKRKRGMRTKNVEVVKDRWTDGLALEISHNGWQTTSISNLDVEDLKRIRKVIRKAIRNHENNKSV